MSRSRKKTPGFTLGGSYRKFAKRQAAKAARRCSKLSSGSSYKKVYDSYDICDYKFIPFTKNEIEGVMDKKDLIKMTSK